jgi:hypothetical protein
MLTELLAVPAERVSALARAAVRPRDLPTRAAEIVVVIAAPVGCLLTSFTEKNSGMRVMVILLLTGTSLYGGGEGYCNRANASVGVFRDTPARPEGGTPDWARLRLGATSSRA